MRQQNGMKRCPGCKLTKSVANFGFDKIYLDGLDIYCRDCRSTISRKHRQANEEKYREHRRKNRVRIQKVEAKRRQRPDVKRKLADYARKRSRRPKVREKRKKSHKIYIRSEHGRQVRKRLDAKRKRNMGFIPLLSNPFPEELLVDDHHINSRPGLVIPIPRKMHRLCKFVNHKSHNATWIQKLYCMDVDDLENSCNILCPTPANI